MSRGYSFLSRLLHWGMALLVIVLAGLGLFMVELASDTPSLVEQKINLYSWHKTLGILALLLGLLRILRTFRAYRPPPLANHHALELAASRAVQTYFLVALLALPLTGLAKHLVSSGPAPIWLWPIDGFIRIANYTAVADVAGAIHYALAYGLLAAFALHVGGALKHQLIDRDITLRRMISGQLREKSVTHEESVQVTRFGVAGGIFLSALAVCFGLLMSPIGGTGDAGSKRTAQANDGMPRLSNAEGLTRWVVDYSKSVLEIEAFRSSKPFAARFDRFVAEIILDPAAPTTGHVNVEIDLASFNSGSADRDRTARANDWFAVDRFPKARFTSSHMALVSDGRYRAEGVLSLKGFEQPVIVEFTLQQDGKSAEADGRATINRSDFAVGTGQWAKDDTIGYNINIRFHIVANR